MKQATEPGSDMAEILELTDWELKQPWLIMLRTLMNKMNNVQEWMDHVTRDIETLRIKRKC